MNTVDDKTVVREYFNATGFDRWRRIYGDGEVNKVQLDIRKGPSANG
jgi:magnesium-protoporphyrin O-methyltransferase